MLKKLLLAALLLVYPATCLGFPATTQLLGARGNTCPDPGDITSNTKLLIHSNNPDGSTSIVDSGPSAHAITVNSITHSTTAAHFGASSMYQNADADYLSIADSDDWSFGSGDFTIGLAINTNFESTTAAAAIIEQFTYSGGSAQWASSAWEIDLPELGGGQEVARCRISNGSTGTTITGTSDITDGAWHTILCYRSGNTLYLNVDGSIEDSTDVSGVTIPNVNRPVTILESQSTAREWFTGYIDHVFIVKGAAVTTFPTTPYSSTCYELDGYTNRVKLTTDSSLVDATVTDFPLAISVDSSSGTGAEDLTASIIADLCGTHDTGDLSYGVAVTESDGYTQLPVEKAYVDCTSEELELHAKVSSLSNSADQDFYLYWDANGSTNDEWVGSIDYNSTKSQAVWRSGIDLVLHFSESGASDLRDSTANGYDFTAVSTDANDDLTGQGFLGMGRYFGRLNATNERAQAPSDYANIDYDAWTDDFSIVTMEHFIDWNPGSTPRRYSKLSSSGEYPLSGQSGDIFYDGGNVDNIGSAILGLDEGWHSHATMNDRSNAQLDFFSWNGSSLSSTLDQASNLANSATNNVAWAIGNKSGSAVGGAEVKFTEFRFYSDNLSEAEAKATVYSLYDDLVSYSKPDTTAKPKNLKVSNGDIYIDQFEDLTGWTDGDLGAAVSSAGTLNGFATANLDTVDSSADHAVITQDVGSYGSTQIVATVRLYFTSLGGNGAGYTTLDFANGTYNYQLMWSTAGLHYYTGAAYVEIGTNLNLVCTGSVATGCWQEWIFVMDWASSSLDVYRKVFDNGETEPVLVASSVSARRSAILDDGWTRFASWGVSALTEVDVDYLKVGTAFLNE